MWHRAFILLSLGFLAFCQDAQAFLPRAHLQWQVETSLRKKIDNDHGLTNVQFSPDGQPIVHGLNPQQQKRMRSFYKLCMSDGCNFCDHPTGSCAKGTCGPENQFCKPHIAVSGAPQCGLECAYYALSRL